MHQTLRACVITLALLVALVFATPLPLPEPEDSAGKTPLRIMPLGASITHGTHSTDGNGYREVLRNKLLSEGYEVNMVGSDTNGTMEDSNNEGHPGFTVRGVLDISNNAVIRAPNLILINVGTNDACAGKATCNTSHTSTDMNHLLDKLFHHIPGTTIILSTLLPNLDATAQARINEFNKEFRSIIHKRSISKEKIVLADMANVIKPSDINTDDKTHPTDEGYRKMAGVWWESFKGAEGLITSPK